LRTLAATVLLYFRCTAVRCDGDQGTCAEVAQIKAKCETVWSWSRWNVYW